MSSRSISDTPTTSTVEDLKADDAKMPAISSLVLMLINGAMLGINMVVTIPTAEDYAAKLGGDELLSGLLIGLLPIGAMSSVVLLGLLLKRGFSMKSLLVLTGVSQFLANVLYAFALLTRWKWTLVISRLLVGLSGSYSLTPLYINLTVGTRRRTEVLFYFGATNTFAYFIGPVLAAVLQYFSDSIYYHDLVLNSDTLSGWLMALLDLLFVVAIIFIFQDLPSEMTARRTEQTFAATKPAESLPIFAICAGMWQNVVGMFVVTAAETYVVNMGLHQWGWSISNSSLFLAAMMLTAGMLNMLVGRFTHRVPSECLGMLVASLLGLLPCALLFDYNLPLVAGEARVFVGMVFLLLTTSVVRSYGYSIPSNLTTASSRGVVSQILTLSQFLGRGCGGIAGMVLNEEAFGPVVLGLVSSSGVVSLAAYKFLQVNRHAES
eukprot:TRINITY_DN112665_c0_g1_i1.p1 TRINITY_DN112665_c0_g1~~TRINITY_DN112665_c0_g1_i1.p1  ORF type:complete len:463 (+),score=40.39 TRINITY_DN112665_c0_g1_i1:86-1390(+)